MTAIAKSMSWDRARSSSWFPLTSFKCRQGRSTAGPSPSGLRVLLFSGVDRLVARFQIGVEYRCR